MRHLDGAFATYHPRPHRSGHSRRCFQKRKTRQLHRRADVTEFQKIQSPDEVRDFVELGQNVFDELASLAIPTVALISGACLGGTRILRSPAVTASQTTAVKRSSAYRRSSWASFPAGGTVRLPRSVGFMEAVPLLLTGRTLNGRQAVRKGLVHDAVPYEALDHVALTILQTDGRSVRPIACEASPGSSMGAFRP